jgi:uncharacterized coiled-coil protein SlyX
VDNTNVKSDVKSEMRKTDKKNDASMAYLKEKMRERAETEVPESDSKSSSARDLSPQRNLALETKLDETKEAVEKVTQKLEELSEEVHDHRDHEASKQSSKK